MRIDNSPLAEAVVTHLACGYYHSVARTREGQVYVFGRNDYGQLGLGHRENRRLPQKLESLSGEGIERVACGCYHTICLSSEGLTFTFGRNNHGQLGVDTDEDKDTPQVVEALRGSRVCQVAAGFYHTLCLVGPPLDQAPRQRIRGTLARDLQVRFSTCVLKLLKTFTILEYILSSLHSV